jgi:hypothetical protein
MDEDIAQLLEKLHRISDRDWKRLPAPIASLLVSIAQEMAFRTEDSGDFEIFNGINQALARNGSAA